MFKKYSYGEKTTREECI